jgi:hypothetical protein
MRKEVIQLLDVELRQEADSVKLHGDVGRDDDALDAEGRPRIASSGVRRESQQMLARITAWRFFNRNVMAHGDPSIEADKFGESALSRMARNRE